MKNEVEYGWLVKAQTQNFCPVHKYQTLNIPNLPLTEQKHPENFTENTLNNFNHFKKFP